MEKIKIINGTYGHREGSFVSAITAGMAPIMVPEDEARRLISLGVAQRVSVEEPATMTDEYFPSYHVGMKVDKLRELLNQCGIAYRVGMSKQGMVEALDAYYEGDELDDGDGLNIVPQQPVL